jgi:hypothetical protein
MVEGSSLIHDGYIGTLCSSRYLVVAVAQLLQELTYPLRCVRGPERHGTTQLHPEPGRAPWQRRRVLRGELRGRRGRCAHTRADMSIFVSRILMHRGVEQRQLVGLITQRSRVRIPPPLPRHPRRILPAGVSVWSSFRANARYLIASGILARTCWGRKSLARSGRLPCHIRFRNPPARER